MISNINDALDTIRVSSEYSDVNILEKREGTIGGEHLYGFYVTKNKNVADGDSDPFGFGLLVSDNGNIDCLGTSMSVGLLELLNVVK